MAITFPLAGYVGLHTQTTDAEVVGKGYVRRAAQFNYCADGVAVANSRTLAWPMATDQWGVIDFTQLWDSLTGGTLLGTFAASPQPIMVDRYDIARIPAGGMAFASVSVPRGYGTGSFGSWRYGTRQTLQASGGGVRLEITFDRSTHVCAPGTWEEDCQCELAA